MSVQTESISTEELWDGGSSPFKISYGKVMMWVFLLSDAFTFTGFLLAYGFMRHRFADIWPVAENVFNHFPFMHGEHPLLFVALMTFILIMSSVTMVLAVEAGQRMKQKQVVMWLGFTLLGGFIFLSSQAWEWYHFIHGTAEGALRLADGTIVQYVNEAKDAFKLPGGDIISGPKAAALMEGATHISGATLTVNEYGHQLFADFFFFITGFHGVHVSVGVILNLVVFVNAIQGTYQRRGHYEMVEKVGLYWHFVDLVWVFVFTFFYLI